MIQFEKIPLLRFFIAFITGLLLARYFQFNTWITLVSYLLFFSFFVISHWVFKNKDEKKEFRFRWLTGFFLNITLLLTGILIVQNNQPLTKPNHFSKYDFSGKTVIVQVDDAPTERKNAIRATLSVKAMKINHRWIKTSGKILQYFEKDSCVNKLKYGDWLIQKAHFTEVIPPQNPHEFNYKNYLAGNNILHQSYVKTNSWKRIDSGHGNPILQLGFEAKNNILKKIETLGIKGDEYAVVTALLLGITDYLDADTLKKYSATGTIHVLSVSGLHVGIFFVILSFLLGFLDKYKRGKFLKALLIISMIWFYALITGLSPSVLRASTMFSFIVLGRYLNRNSNIYNTLLLSALILIMIDPNIVSNLGFLLSYLAVTGIVYLYPKFYNTLKVKNYFLDQIWSLVCVSMAAQIASSPLSVYYFSQFPNYFLLSNIIVVPLTTLIVYSGVAFLALSFIPFVSDIIAVFLSYLLFFLNYVVGFIEGLPFCTSIYVIDSYQMFLLYAFIIFVIIYFEKIKPVFLHSALVCLIGIITISSYKKVNDSIQKEFIVYSMGKGLAIDLVTGNNAIFIADSGIINNPRLVDFHIKNNRVAMGIKKVMTLPFHLLFTRDTLLSPTAYIYKNFIGFCDSKIVLIGKNSFYFKDINKYKADYLIINDIQTKRAEEIFSVFNQRNIIFTKNLNDYQTKALFKILKKEKNIIYDIKKSGAYIQNFY